MKQQSKTLSDRARQACWWVAGVCREDMKAMPARTQMAYTTVGMVLIANSVVLVAAWATVGWRYFGPVGLFIPGLVIPFVFVFGLDRLVAMGRRRLKGDLAAFEPPGPRKRNPEAWFRVGFASMFAALTTFTFMLDLSESSIRARQIKAAAVANEPLRREYIARLSQTSALVMQQNQARAEQIDEETRGLQADIRTAGSTLVEAENAARKAAEEMAREEGGVERMKGRGERYAAQGMIRDVNLAAAQAGRGELARLRERAAALEGEAAKLRAGRVGASDEMRAQLDGVDDRIKRDERYVAPQHGLFSDASTFIALYSDKDEGTGRWWISMLISEGLFGLECAALLAIRINPESVLDVLRRVDTQQRASAMEADAAVYAARASVRAAPARGRSASPGRANVTS
jgi:hypothetical protein